MPDDREIALPVSSSTPPVFCKQQESLFREVIQLLESNHVPFVISGAFALHEHTGIWRDTKDLEMLLPAQEVGRAPEELNASKIFVTRRERFDGADICHVIYGTQGKFDWHRLLALIGDHWQMLFWSLVLYHYVYPANSDYVPAQIWQELVQRFSVELAHPNKGANFRGSLIDDKMFAIDVAEWGRRNILEELREKAELIHREKEEAA